MMVTFAVWLVVFGAAAGYGRLLAPATRNDDGASGAVQVYAGLLLLSTMLLTAALFTNLSPGIGAGVALPGVALFWRSQLSFRELRYPLAGLMVLALFISVREINFYDTGLYHQQAVKWLAQHGIVRGLALVDFRLGYVSSWFAFAAPLDHGITAGRVGIVGGLPLALAVIPAFPILGRVFGAHCASASSTTFAVVGLILAAVAVLWHVDASLSPDMIVWLLPAVILVVLAERDASDADQIGRAMILASLACLVKLSAAPVLAYCVWLAAWRFLRFSQDRWRLAGFAVAAMCALTVLFATNLFTSGCLLFPSPFGCTSVEWSVGAVAARSLHSEFVQFARLPRHNQMLPLTAVAAVASLFVATAFRRAFARHVLGISWLGIAFVWLSAPVPRFGLGYFFLPIGAAIALTLARFAGAVQLSFLPRRSWAIGLAGAAITVLLVIGGTRDAEVILYPKRIASANGDPIHIVNRAVDLRGALAMKTEQMGDLKVWVPISSDQCWDAPLPCTANRSPNGLVLRNGKNFDGGFLQPLRSLEP